MSHTVMVCCRVADLPGDRTADGSKVRWCEICAEEVWVSPTGLEFIESESPQVICADCSPGLPGAADAPVQPVPGSVDELRAKGYTDVEIQLALAMERRRVRGS